MRATLGTFLSVVLCCAPETLAGEGNLLKNGDIEKGAAAWQRFGQGFAVDTTVAHAGKASLRCRNAAAGQVSGALQEIEVNQHKPVPLVARGWSKAEGVNGNASPDYSIYCDVEFTTDVRPGRVDLPGQTINLSTGTHDWAFGERIIEAAAPIKSVKFYALFRRRYTGTVWFDDLYLGPLAQGPLTGAATDFPALPAALAPEGFAEAVASLAQDRMLVHVQQQRTQPYHVDPMRLWLAGKLAQEGKGRELCSARHVLPWTFPRGFVNPPEAAPYTGLWLRRTWGEAVLDVETQGKQGAAFRYTVALPKQVSVREVAFDGWEPSFDDVQAGRLGDRIVLSILTETQSGRDRISFRLMDHGKPKQPPKGAERPAVSRNTLRTNDGLEVDVANDGWIDALRVAGRDVADGRISQPSPDALSTGAGFYVGDLCGEGFQLVGGTIQPTDTGLRQRARLPGMEIDFEATYTVRPDRIDIDAALQDTALLDRAVDVVFKLPLAADGWTWWDDVTHSQTVSAKQPVKTDTYPWITLTSPDGSAGLTLAVPPNRPCAFTFLCEPADRLLYVRMPLGLSMASKTPGRAAVALTLFRTDGKWGFRDAARRYYRAFPDAFRRIAKKDGGWLFACRTAKLKNPEDYAYNEAGPAGWQLDEKLGILTCPYRIPTQRQIVFPSLPESDEQAMQWIERKSRTLTPEHWRTRSAGADAAVHYAGKHSLRCEASDAEASASATQDVVLNQQQAKPIAIAGQCRAENVAGKPDSHFGLWADLHFADGTHMWGKCVQFNTGTHDWEAAQVVIAPNKPVQMVRLHVLMRKGHTGRAWFDDFAVREAGAAKNFVRNPGFEQASPHRYAAMMQHCASHNAHGHPYIVRRDNCGADVLPKNPIYNVVYSVNCDPDLFADRDVLTVGKYELDLIGSMLSQQPKLDGIYLDSTSGWVSRHLNYRREHFRYVAHALTYDPRTGRPVALGWLHTYEFMAELQKRLAPQGKVVFPNIGRGRVYPFFYFVCDVIGLEGGLRRGDFESQLNFYRTLAYHKPVLVMDYIEVIGRPTRHADRAGFERFWKWCVLYGVHPSIGRSCVEAYERFGDVYRRFREPLRKLGAAGWEPVTHASASQGVRLERFGDVSRGLFFTVLNSTDEPKDVKLELDAAGLGLQPGYIATDLLADRPMPARPMGMSLAPGDLGIVQIAPGKAR